MSKISDVNLSVEQLGTHIRNALRGNAMTLHDYDKPKDHLSSSESDNVERADLSDYAAREFSPLRMQPKFQPTADDRYHVDELLRFHDREFVRNAYRALLKRTPEAGGFTEYLEQLREGSANKIDVLGSIHYSPEGARRGVRVKGLRLPFLLRRAGRLPIVGYLVRWMVALLRLPVLVHNYSQFTAYATTQFEHIAEHTNHLASHFNDEINHFAHLTVQQLDQLNESQRRLQADVTAYIATHEDRFARQDMRFDKQEAQATHFHARLERYNEQLEDVLEQIQADTAAAVAQRVELQNLKQKLQYALMEFNLQTARSAQIAREIARDSHTALQPETETPHANARHFTDAMYAAFEDRFRGTPDEIKKRLSVYLPLIHRVPEGDMLDLGSGRGEWLELLRAEGRSARGVDKNRVFVADCRARGMEVIEDDILSYLRSLESNSLAMVSGFHIVEHLTLDALAELLTETARVLLPGGMALFETPNPENVLVGSFLFYIDPTHRNPLPSLTLHFLMEWHGFDCLEILNLQPYKSARLTPMNERDHTTIRFNELFYGAMDYGISGWKPKR